MPLLAGFERFQALRKALCALGVAAERGKLKSQLFVIGVS